MPALVVLARAGADGCRGFARGRAPRDFWAVSQEMGVDFAMGPGLLCGFRRELFAVEIAGLGKRRCWVAFRAGSACETVQKLQAGFACVEGGASNVCLDLVGAGRKHCGCRAACVDSCIDVLSVGRGRRGFRERSGWREVVLVRWLYAASREISALWVILETESPAFSISV